MNNSFSYSMPVKIIFGANELVNIDSYIGNRKTVLVTSAGFVKRGLVDIVKSYTANIIEVVTEIASHPEFKDLEPIYNRINRQPYDLILAIGGGSVLDAAKYFSIYDESGQATVISDYIKSPNEGQIFSHKPVIAVPTTAGTGSELTPWATVWDMQAKKKYSLHLPYLFNELALYDPVLTLTLPWDITLQTALDALSHSLESIWNKNASPPTVNNAVKAAKLIMGNIVPLFKQQDNLEYRSNILQGCMFAGLAFSNTQTALAHAMSYYITANKNVPHGIACSFTLPMLIDKIAGEYDYIDGALTAIFGELSSEPLRAVFKQLSIATEFSDYGLTTANMDELKSKLFNNQRAGNSLITSV